MGIVNAVDICKYPQHFNRLLLIAMNKYVLFLIFIFSCIGCGETNEQDANTIEGNTDTSQITIAPVTNLKAKITQNPNELYLTWTNPITVTNMLGVEIYYKQKGSNDEKRVNTIQKGEGYVLRLTSAEPYFISVVVVDNYGRKSERVTITAIPSNKGVPLADSCTYVLIEQFMDKTKGTFWVSPQNISGNSANTYIYWQQAHAIDVVYILMNVSKIIILYWLRHIKNILKDGFKIMEIIIITTTTILQAFQIHILMICVGLV